MNFITEIIVKFRDLLKQNEHSRFHPESAKDDQMHVMSDDEKVDQAVEESFPASDPPGHISKSAEDLKQY
jgi:hypothetical protein